MHKKFQTVQRTLGVLNYLEVGLIRPSSYQLRDEVGNLDELTNSIKQNGLLQPIIVRPVSDLFEVVAGNRRLAACKQLHMSKILCFMKDISEKEAYEISIIENIERRTLDAIEEARAFKHYVEEFGYGSVSELARQLGRSEEYVSHRILLLTLPTEILEKVRSHQLSPTNAQELIWLRDHDKRILISNEAVRRRFSQSRLRSVVKLVKNDVDVKKALTAADSQPDFGKIESEDGKIVDKSLKVITEASLIFKGTLIQLDSLLNRCTEDSELKEFLMKKRYFVHHLLDELIALGNSRGRSVHA